MALLRFSALFIALLRVLAVFAAESEPLTDADASKEKAQLPDASSLGVKVRTSFPQSEIFGVKLVNGQPTQAILQFSNPDTTPINVAFIGGSLWAPDPKTKGETSMIVRNITSTRYNVQIPAEGEESINYSFATELHPQELRLNLVTVLTTDKGAIYTLNAYNETVSIVEPDASFFDLQLIFLYLLLLVMFAGSCLFIYNTWITTLFPQKRKGGKGGERAKRSSGGSKKVDPSDQVAVVGADGPAVTSGAKAYDESWIPEHHINRPEAKRLKSGGGRPKSRGKPE
ncbi:MAG: hypothetical protein LQ340_005201 [Diploschistes diacapsis]|nr:MAG: hypothetical protein LQ340_005201 [Diploschistes diacapsis]